jgi:hypothetical protein
VSPPFCQGMGPALTHALILVRAIQEWVKGGNRTLVPGRRENSEVDQFGTPGLLGLEQL